MANSMSGSLAIAGLSGSGTDFQLVLEKLKDVERTQVKRLEYWKDDWNLRYEAFGQIIDQVKAAKSVLDQLANRSNFVKKNVVSSNENVLTAIASAMAQDVQHTIEVKQVASNAIWANTGHQFATKTDLINVSGGTEAFQYTYAGKDYSVNIPNNTTLESFMNLVNNAIDNPGVQISIIKTGSGYVFQAAGKQTGVDNDLVIHDANLVGMSASGSTSVWLSNYILDPAQTVTNPTGYVYDIVLDNGTQRTVSIGGNATKAGLAAAIDGQINGVGSASVDGSGNLVMTGVQSVSRREAGAAVGSGTVQGHLSPTDATTVLTFDPAKLADQISGASPAESLTYTVTLWNGSTTSVSLMSDATNQNLLTALAAATGAAVSGGSNEVLTLDGVQGIALTTGSDGMSGFSSVTHTTTTIDDTDFPGGLLETPPPLNYSVTKNDGTVVSVSLASGSTMTQVLDALRTEPALAGDVKFYKADGTLETVWPPTEPVYLSIDNIMSASGPGANGQVAASSNWSIQRSSNAVYTVDNWPMEMESASNSVTDVIDGVVFDIQDVGTARISVSTDIPALEESIQYFLDAINSVLLTVRDLTIWDDKKNVTSLDPNDKNYSPSQLTSEKGGLLQGNYGVQLFKSRLTGMLTSAPPGFKSIQDASNILSGDMVSTLSAMGIKICTDSNDPNYGLYTIAPMSNILALQELDQEHYNDMITNHLQDVVDFFCTSGSGASTSADFRYASHVEGITKAGMYDVEYEVTGGVITSVTVGGVAVQQDASMPGYYYSVGSGDAAGLSISIDNLAEGTHSGQVRIKQGLVQTVDRFFKDELVYTPVEVNANDPVQADAALELKSKNGALMVLQANYLDIMKGIDKKIAREQVRIDLWEQRQKTIFANLETLLGQYAEQQKRLESEIGQLSGGS